MPKQNKKTRDRNRRKRKPKPAPQPKAKGRGSGRVRKVLARDLLRGPRDNPKTRGRRAATIAARAATAIFYVGMATTFMQKDRILDKVFRHYSGGIERRRPQVVVGLGFHGTAEHALFYQDQIIKAHGTGKPFTAIGRESANMLQRKKQEAGHKKIIDVLANVQKQGATFEHYVQADRETRGKAVRHSAPLFANAMNWITAANGLRLKFIEEYGEKEFKRLNKLADNAIVHDKAAMDAVSLHASAGDLELSIREMGRHVKGRNEKIVAMIPTLIRELQEAFPNKSPDEIRLLIQVGETHSLVVPNAREKYGKKLDISSAKYRQTPTEYIASFSYNLITKAGKNPKVKFSPNELAKATFARHFETFLIKRKIPRDMRGQIGIIANAMPKVTWKDLQQVDKLAKGKPFTTRVALMWQHVVTKYGPTSKK